MYKIYTGCVTTISLEKLIISDCPPLSQLILEYSKVRSSNPSLLILEAIKTEETTISESLSFCFVDFQINILSKASNKIIFIFIFDFQNIETIYSTLV